MSLVLVGLTLATLTTAPPELKSAETLMSKYKYAEALTALKKARAAKGLDRASLLRILELQGIAAGQQRQAAPATAAFTELLTLDPAHKLAEEYAPRVMTPFFEAGQAVNEAGSLTLTALPPEASQGRITALVVQLTRDPLSQVRQLVFHFSQGAATGWQTRAMSITPGGSAKVAVDASEVSWWVEALGDADAQLSLLGSDAQPLTATPPAPLVTAAPPPPPAAEPVLTKQVPRGGGVRTASFFVVGGAAVAAGVGTFFGLRSSSALGSINNAPRDADGRITSITERQAATLGAQAATDGTIANVCFVGAGALAAAGVVMFIVGGPETPSKVALAPAPGGLLVTGSFP